MATTFVPFSFEADFTNISARSGNTGGRVPTDGIYPITVLDCGLNVKEGETPETARSVGFSVQITEGEFAGFKTWINAGIDMGKLGNRISWKTILVSLGFDEGALLQFGGGPHLDLAGGACCGVVAALRVEKSGVVEGLGNREVCLVGEDDLAGTVQPLEKVGKGTLGEPVWEGKLACGHLGILPLGQ